MAGTRTGSRQNQANLATAENELERLQQQGASQGDIDAAQAEVDAARSFESRVGTESEYEGVRFGNVRIQSYEGDIQEQNARRLRC